MTELDPELLAREGHGAVQVDLPTTALVVLTKDLGQPPPDPGRFT